MATFSSNPKWPVSTIAKQRTRLNSGNRDHNLKQCIRHSSGNRDRQRQLQVLTNHKTHRHTAYTRNPSNTVGLSLSIYSITRVCVCVCVVWCVVCVRACLRACVCPYHSYAAKWHWRHVRWRCELWQLPGPFLLAWDNFNPSKDKESTCDKNVGWTIYPFPNVEGCTVAD